MQALFYLANRRAGAELQTIDFVHSYFHDLDSAIDHNAWRWVSKAVDGEWYLTDEFERAAEQAAAGGKLDVLRVLIQAVTCDLDELIDFAAENGHLDIIQYLESEGGDAHSNEECALRSAAHNGHLEVVEYLADIDPERLECDDNDAILGAAANGHDQVVRFLLSKGVPLNTDEFQALDAAYMRHHWLIVDIYIEVCGARVVLFQAAEWGYKEMVMYVCNRGIEQETAHMAARIAASCGQLRVVEFLTSDANVLNTVVLESIITNSPDSDELVELWASLGGSVDTARTFFLAAASVGDRAVLMCLLVRFAEESFDYHQALWEICIGCKDRDCAEFLTYHFQINPILILLRACAEDHLFAFIFAAELFPAEVEKHSAALLQDARPRVGNYIRAKSY